MNRVKIAQNWFEIIGAATSRLQPQRQRLRRIPDNIIWIQHTAASAASRSGLRSVSNSATYRVGDSWETVTYTALWLCGLIAIGLCWV